MISTDYTEQVSQDSLKGTHISKYRLCHWLCDILKNFMRDPINIMDERLRSLLHITDIAGDDGCRSLFQIGLPFSTDTRKACTTPAILVSAGETSYPAVPINNGINCTLGVIGAEQMYKRSVCRAVTASIAILTESLDGTQLLCDTIEDFLVTHALELAKDGMVSQFNVQGSTAPALIQAGEGGNAKNIYQSVIKIAAIGGITWSVDTQGPVFRGVDAKLTKR